MSAARTGPLVSGAFVLPILQYLHANPAPALPATQPAAHHGVPARHGTPVRRARPVVLTALAAILAMIPLTRSTFFAPMAVAIMGGLLVATALTLLFLPALYAAWFKVQEQP